MRSTRHSPLAQGPLRAAVAGAKVAAFNKKEGGAGWRLMKQSLEGHDAVRLNYVHGTGVGLVNRLASRSGLGWCSFCIGPVDSRAGCKDQVTCR
jgi:hypothetical protein